MTKRNTTKPLTALAVKNHRTGTITDSHPHRGLRLVANKDTSRSWIYRYKVGDKLKQVKLGSYPDMGLQDARNAYNTNKAAKQNGKDPQVALAIEKAKVAKAAVEELEQVVTDPKIFTVRKMATQYIDEEVSSNRKEKGTLYAQNLLLKHLGDFANRPVESIELIELHEHIVKIRKRTPNTAGKWRQEFKAAWEYAVNSGRLKVPCLINSKTGGKIKQVKGDRVFNDKEISYLVKYMREHFSPTSRDVLIMALYTGLRTGEVIAIHERELTTEDDGVWLNIPAERMKMKKAHRVPLVGTALKIVESRLGTGYLFPSRKEGEHIAQKTLSYEIWARKASNPKLLKSRVGCTADDVKPHDYRRTARTVLAELGVPHEIGETILSHTIGGVAAIYNRYTYDAEKRVWLTKLNTHLNKVVKNG